MPTQNSLKRVLFNVLSPLFPPKKKMYGYATESERDERGFIAPLKYSF